MLIGRQIKGEGKLDSFYKFLFGPTKYKYLICTSPYITAIFRSGTDLIIIATHSFFLLVRRSSKKSKAQSFQIGSGWNLAGLFFK